MDKLDYEFHHAEYASLIGDSGEESRLWIKHKAEQMHIYAVHDALGDEQIKSVEFSHALKDSQAQYFARFGIARRLGLIWAAFRSILDIVPVDREIPLSTDDVRT